MITPRDFVDRWANSQLREQQAAQSHFNELCQLVGHKTPTELDPQGTFFTFEEQVTKATGGKGRADVWYKGRFAWEYKGKHRDLDDAYAQLLAYKGDLDNPPLLVVCDFLEYRIYPQWPNTSGLPFVFKNEDLLRPDYLRFITWLLESPEQFLALRQSELERRERITLQLAEKFAHLADLMRNHTDAQGHKWEAMRVARFLTKLVFALFAEDVGLMPTPFDQPVFRYLVDGAKSAPGEFVEEMGRLFAAMDGQRENFVMKPTPYFNGGIFRDSREGAGDGYEVLDLTQIPDGINLLGEVSEADWRFVNPTIFGTLFEGALDISKRAQLGAHYTGESDIRLVVDPVLMQPLYREWDALRAEAEPLLQTYLNTDAPKTKQQTYDQLLALHNRMMTRLETVRVLDPACGSGNFLYMSLRALKDLEGRVRKFFEPLGLPFRDVVTPRQLYGIEKDEFAANLAKVVVWIGYLQWRYEDEGGVLHFYNSRKQPHPRQLPHPVLKDKNSPDEPDRIVCDDAIMRYRKIAVSSPSNSLSAGREGEPKHTSDSPSLYTERGVGGEVLAWAEKERRWLTPTELWDKLKPLARQMRHEATPAEDALWELLRNRKFEGLKFRRQHTIDRFIADFYCAEANLIVEVDGDIHQYTQEEDSLRTAFLESQGMRVIRVQNEDVLRKPEPVLSMLRNVLAQPSRTSPSNSLSASSEGEPKHTSDSPSLYTERGVGGEVLIPYEPDWPEVDVIMGNPPFLGGNRIRGELGSYVDDLFHLYDGRVPAFADLVCYWYEKARVQIEKGKAKRTGLLATNSIRGGANRAVLDRIKNTGDIFMAWSDRAWVLAGAAVRISIVGFDSGKEEQKLLDGKSVVTITSDLVSTLDITKVQILPENINISFQGPSPKGSFDVKPELAKQFLQKTNPTGNQNSDVVRPVLNAADITKKSRGYWTIDFPPRMSLDDAKKYLAPFEYVEKNVYPEREKNNRDAYRIKWWIYAEARPGMRSALSGLNRYIATPRHSKHRMFVWVSSNVLCNDAVIVFAREDDYFFGVLHSYLHEIWALRLGTWLGVGNDPRYTPTTTFETFPFPWSPGKEDTSSPHHAAISAAAKQLNEEREAWLNPPDLIALGAGSSSKALKERTLTNLYNALVAHRAGKPNGEKLVKPARDFAPRLAQLHDTLDAAVLSAYGWDDLISPSLYTERGSGGEVLSLRAERGSGGEVLWRTPEGDEELLRRLLELNAQRAAS